MIQDMATIARNYVPENEVLDEVEKMVCSYFNECLGGVFDYSTAFKRTFGGNVPPRCFGILSAMAKKKEKSIRVPNWSRYFRKHYTC